MSHREFQSWKRYYRSRPFDDLHRFHRPAAVMAHSFGGGGGDFGKTIDLLVNETSPERLEQSRDGTKGPYSEADLKTLAALGGLSTEV